MRAYKLAQYLRPAVADGGGQGATDACRPLGAATSAVAWKRLPQNCSTKKGRSRVPESSEFATVKYTAGGKADPDGATG